MSEKKMLLKIKVLSNLSGFTKDGIKTWGRNSMQGGSKEAIRDFGECLKDHSGTKLVIAT